MKKAKRLACMALLVVAVSGCGVSAGRDGYLSKEEATTEYRKEAKSWELAPGWAWPSVPYSGKGPDGSAAMYQQSSGQVDATFYWFCSWASAWLEAESPSERTTAASQLSAVPNSSFYKKLLPKEREYFDEHVIDPISKGEVARPRQVIGANCHKGS